MPSLRTNRPHAQRGEAQHWLIGCSIAFVVVVVVAVVASLWLIRSAKSIGTNFVRDQIVEQLEVSSLPDDQKNGVIAQIDRVADDFKANRISAEQLTKILEHIGQSPVLPVSMAYFAREQYIAPSGLSDEAKADADRTIQRYARGVFEKTIEEEVAKATLKPLSKPQSAGSKNVQLKENVTDAELNEFLDLAKAAADDAEVPDEPYQVDIAGEIKRAVDEALGVAEPDALDSSPQEAGSDADDGAPDAPPPPGDSE